MFLSLRQRALQHPLSANIVTIPDISLLRRSPTAKKRVYELYHTGQNCDVGFDEESKDFSYLCIATQIVLTKTIEKTINTFSNFYKLFVAAKGLVACQPIIRSSSCI